MLAVSEVETGGSLLSRGVAREIGKDRRSEKHLPTGFVRGEKGVANSYKTKGATWEQKSAVMLRERAEGGGAIKKGAYPR